MYEFMYNIANPVGMVGVVIILIAYYFLSIDRWKSTGMNYQLLNFIGAWLILFSLMFHWNLSSVVIEIAWLIISFIGMYRIVKNNKSSPPLKKEG
jgi:hypothetical protein